MNKPTIIHCAGCGAETVKTGNFQKYCRKCSLDAAEIRKAKWYGDHKEQEKRAARLRKRETNPLNEQGRAEAGRMRSTSETLCWVKRNPEFKWMVRVCIPFHYSVSKNYVYGFNNWHVFKRQKSREYSDQITREVRDATKGLNIVQNKLWIAILVEKPDQRGDAVNVIDTVCDAIKKAIDLDDRWFSIRQLDWRISKNEPNLFIEIGQESSENVQACSYCGHLKPFSEFGKGSSKKHGIGRLCHGCNDLAKKLTRDARELKKLYLG